MIIVKSVVTAVVAFVYWIIYYLWMPPLSLGYFDGFCFIAIGVLLLSILVGWWISGKDGITLIPAGIALALIVVSGIIGLVAGSSLFNASTMYNQIGQPDNKSFTNDIVEIDTSQIPTVDIKLASKLSDKKLGENFALGSQVDIGEFTNKQQVNDKLLYVAPLDHSGFFKWHSNSSGTPGFVTVSATNSNDVKLVNTTADGSEIHLRYLQSAYLGDNLKRHIRSSGYRSVGLTEYSFELNDEGYPFWVVTTYKNTTLWRNPEATGVVICDPQTGKCEWYSVKDAPEWVDIIQPEEFVINQLEHYGKYVHGWWNPSNKDELSVTEHVTTVFNDGDCYYYTGMSSTGADEGTIGFAMINTRTKKFTFYKMSGATESAAMGSAKGNVQHMGYKSTEPIPINVSGVPTYFSTLKDDAGLVKMYAMVNIENYSIVATGSSISETKKDYLNAVSSSGASVDFGDNTEVYGYTLTGKVSRITANVESGNTFYYIILDDDHTKLFLASYTVSDELPITREGDTVTVSYISEGNGTITISSFDNDDFSQEISEGQEKINQDQKENTPSSSITDVDPDANEDTWNNLSDEEKAKLLKEHSGS